MFSTAIKEFLSEKNYPSFQLRAVFFDMDGVIFDSMRNHAFAWVKAMQEINIPFTEYDAYMNEGRTGQSTIDGAFNRTYNRDATEDEKQQIYKLKTKYFEDCDDVKKMPFTYELLNKVKQQGLEIYVVTGSGQLSLLDSLDHHFPGIFQKDKMVTAFDVTQGKPFPEPYLKGLEKSGLNPWEVMVIENAPLGVESAKAANLFTIGVNTGPLNPEELTKSGADIIFHSMEELFLNWDKFDFLALDQTK